MQECTSPTLDFSVILCVKVVHVMVFISCLTVLFVSTLKKCHYCYLGEANVLQDFEVTEGKKKVHVAGCRCTKGILRKTGRYRLQRGQEIIYDG
jgi:hypothetical protein